MSENLGSAMYELTINSLNELDTLNSFSETQKENFSVEIRLHDGDRYQLPNNNKAILNQTVSLKISKLNRSDFYVFFSEQGFSNGLKEKEIYNRNCIYINSNFSEFSSRRCKFKTLNGVYATVESYQPPIDPRKFIKDSSGGELVKDLEFWITNQIPSEESNIFTRWLEIALKKSTLLFCSEIWSTGNSLNLVFKGVQTLEISFNEREKSLAPQHIKILEAASWILELDREVEIRHSLISSRIANEQLRREDSWPELLERSLTKILENSKNDYKAYLHSKSSETLKLIAEIRKSIAEESAKIIDRTHALSSTLFRDIAIAFGTISVKFLALKNKDDFKAEILFLLLFTACWLAASLCITTSTNKMYIISLTKSRFFWSRKVNQSIPITEFKELSERPFRDAVKAYNKTRRQASLVYGLVIVALIAMALSSTRWEEAITEKLESIENNVFLFDFSHYRDMP
ncbi:hypothetical protein [Pseudomonas sp. L1(2025)]|uniref:hypothetical protein n=1 Tax=Pseudomonas sp. L1(2025) TaxID=3449429 RepID=UPI003F68D280